MLYRVLACLAAALCFSPITTAQSQAYTFFGIPWGTDRLSAETRLRGLGLRQVKDVGSGRVEYSSDSSRVFVSFDGGRLAGVQESYEMIDNQEAINLFHSISDSLRQTMGNADSSGVQIRVWKRSASNERLSLSVYVPASGDSLLPTVYLSREGPGYAAALKRYLDQLYAEIAADLYGWVYDRAPAERWQMIFYQSDRGVLYERARVRRTPSGTWRVWMRTVLRDAATTRYGERYDLYMMDSEIDCAGRRTRSYEFVSYLGNNVVASNSGVSLWERWLPESVGEGMYEAFCQRMRSGR